MPSVVIIHAPDDALPARALAEKLRNAKLNVSVETPAGDARKQAARDAEVAVALWSPRSVADAGVSEDASFAKRNGNLIHARMQNAVLPGEFASDKSVDLTGWRGEDEFPAWRELAKQVTAKAGVASLPPPAPRPASGFFQPGMAAPGATAAPSAERPRTQAPISEPPRREAPPNPGQYAPPPPRPSPLDEEPKKSGNVAMIAIIAFLAVALIGGGGYFVYNNMQGAKSAQAEWSDVSKTDPAALRAFMQSHTGALHDQAQTALTQLEEASYQRAHSADSIDALQSFLSNFPDSGHALEARGRIAELQSAPTTTDTLVTSTTTDTTTTNPDLLPPTATDTTAPAPETTEPSNDGPVPLGTATTTP